MSYTANGGRGTLVKVKLPCVDPVPLTTVKTKYFENSNRIDKCQLHVQNSASCIKKFYINRQLSKLILLIYQGINFPSHNGTLKLKYAKFNATKICDARTSSSQVGGIHQHIERFEVWACPHSISDGLYCRGNSGIFPRNYALPELFILHGSRILNTTALGVAPRMGSSE